MHTPTLPYAVETSRPRFLGLVFYKELLQNYELNR